MNCRRAGELIERARDERLPDRLADSLGEHLVECPGCSRVSVLDSCLTEALDAARGELAELSAPSDFSRRVKERLLASSEARTEHDDPSWRTLAAGLAAAVILAGSLLGLHVLEQQHDPAVGAAIATGPPVRPQALPPLSGTERAASTPRAAEANLARRPLVHATGTAEIVLLSDAEEPSSEVTDF